MHCAIACGLTSGTTSGTSGSIRNREVLSITTAPAFVARGANASDTLAPGRRKDDVDAAKIVGVEALDLEDIILAERNLAADRARRGKRHDIIGGKLALGERGQDFASDIAGRADHRYPETHIETPRANMTKLWLLTYDAGRSITRIACT